MTGQQLKNSILQEAIQGRLVPNVLQPGEKTGAELLQDILAERQKKEIEEKGKKAKKISLSVIEEEPWELPEGWCWCEIGDLCEIINGFTPLRSNPGFWNNPTIPWFTVDDIREQGRIITTTKQAINTKALAKDSNRLLPSNTVLLCCTASLGESALTKIPLTTNQQFNGLIVPSFLRESILPNYLFSIMPYYKEVLNSICGKTTFGFVSVSKVSKMQLPLPPLSIQKLIVEKIEALFPLVDEYDKAAGELKTLNEELPDKLRKSVLQEAIHGNLVSNDIPEGEATAAELLQQILKERQGRENKEKGKKAKKLTLSKIEEEPWELPEGWCWCKLGDVGSWGAGATPQRGNAGFYQNGTIPWLKTGELNNGVVYDTEEKVTELALEKCSLRLCQPNDVLIAMYGATIGKLALAGVPLTTNQACCACTPYTNIFNKYIFFFLLAKKDDFTKQAFGGAQPNISKEKIVSTDFPLPPLSIQKAIVAKIEEVFADIDKLEHN